MARKRGTWSIACRTSALNQACLFLPGVYAIVDAWVSSGGPVYLPWSWDWEFGGYQGQSDSDYSSFSWGQYSSSGVYSAYVDAYSAGGSDDAHSYVYAVAVTQVVSTAETTCVGQNVTFGAITNPLNCAPYVTVTWSGGGTPSTGSGSQFTTNWSTPGTKTVTATCGTSSAQKDVTIFDVAITTPSSFPVYVQFGGSVQLDCTPLGATGGTYAWSGSGPGTVTFSPSSNVKNPSFSANQSGDYTVTVIYSMGGAAAGDTSGTIKVVRVTQVISSADYAPVGQNVTFGALTNPPNSGPYVTITWSGGQNPASGSGSQFTTNWSTPGLKTVTATCGSSSAQKNVTIVAVDKVVKAGTGDMCPLYPGCPGTSVSLEAKPNPPGASFPTGEPHWEIVSKPEGASASLIPNSGSATTTLSGLNKWGDYVVRAKSCDSDTGDTITIRFNLINETGYSYYSPDWGSIPDECPPEGDGDGEDSYELDDCDNELEVSCCRSDGSGGDTGNAYRYFYNGSLVSSCPWSYSPENSFNRKTATIEGTGLTYVTKMKHSSIGGYNFWHKWYEGCIGYYCSMFVFHDCITGSTGVYWRRSSEYPPQDYYEGEYCPGH